MARHSNYLLGVDLGGLLVVGRELPSLLLQLPHSCCQLTKLGFNVHKILSKLSVGGLLALYESLKRVLKVLFVGGPCGA